MKKFTAFLSALVLLVALPVIAWQQHPTRANQGHPPPPPPARTAPPAAAARPAGGGGGANQGRSDGERFVNGHVNDTQHVNHDQWYAHAAPNDPRFHIDHPFAAGHFANFGPDHRYGITRFDPASHRFWFRGGGYFTVADWDWLTFSDWCWNCGDDFVVYEDPDHPGWYLLYDTETGAYIHVTYDGM